VCISTGTRNPDTSTWTLAHVLTEHDLLISAVDWSPVHNKIVTCSHDRNAFVWTYKAVPPPKGAAPTAQPEVKWSPSLTVLRIDRAALDVKWSPDGKKFAVASGAKCVPVCHYEAEQVGAFITVPQRDVCMS
jgi:actin related protein 2/3 complex subunit 1A/1B